MKSWTTRVTFDHSSGTTIRDGHGQSGGGGVVVQHETSLIVQQAKFGGLSCDVGVSFSAPRKNSLPGVALAKLRSVQLKRYTVYTTKKGWSFELGISYEATTMLGVERLIATGGEPTAHYIEITHLDWSTYHTEHSAAHASASLAMKVGDILDLMN
jgi:hypothetical protein